MMGLWTLDFSTKQIVILPYEDLGPIADYAAKVAAAKKWMGKKYCLAQPINGRLPKREGQK